MEAFRGLSAELYQAIVAIVDERLREIRVTRESFDRLTQAVTELAEAQRQLTAAQTRTEARVGRLEEAVAGLAEAQRQLTEAQTRTEARVGRLEEAVVGLAEAQRQLTEAQARTEARVGRLEEAVAGLAEGQRQLTEEQRRLTEGQRQLTAAQARTEAALQQTQSALQQLARQVGGLSETVGGDIEDIAYIVLHEVLGREFGWEVGVLERTWQRWDGEPEEVDVFGQAIDPAQPGRTLWIVGEAKHNLTLREVERFAQQVERARRHLKGEVYAVCFCYRARPEVRARLKALEIPLLFSYGRFA